jgi:hypothetical protein
MALTIEDGTGVTGADSYVSISDIRTYALNRNLTLPAGDAEIEALARGAVDYLEGRRLEYKGIKSTSTQALQWPRTDLDADGVIVGIEVDGYELGLTAIPKELKLAQCQLCIEINTTDILPTSTTYPVKREKVDAIETEYAVKLGSEPILPEMPKVEGLLAPLLKPVPFLTSVRI